MDLNNMVAMDRRSLLGQIALLIGATNLPADAFAAPARAVKRFLTPAQFATLNAIADTILPATDTPGALAAGVPGKLDGLLSAWASAATRRAITTAIGKVDAAAKAKTGKGFAALAAKQRDAVLRPHDAAALKKVPPPPGAPTNSFFSVITYVADPGYHKLKELVINLYYYSEIATTKELVYEHVPGKFQPSIKLTAASRPYLGTGPF